MTEQELSKLIEDLIAVHAERVEFDRSVEINKINVRLSEFSDRLVTLERKVFGPDRNGKRPPPNKPLK